MTPRNRVIKMLVQLYWGWAFSELSKARKGNPPSSSLCKIWFAGARNIILREKIPWYVKVWEMWNLVTKSLKFLLTSVLLQQNPGISRNLSNIHLQLAKWCWNSHSFTFYVLIDYFHTIFMLRKPNEFSIIQPTS